MSLSMQAPKIIICVILMLTIGFLTFLILHRVAQTAIIEECIDSLEPGAVVKVEKKIFWTNVTCEKDYSK